MLFVSFRLEASDFAWRITSELASMPMTEPFDAIVAKSHVMVPGPHPMSRILWFGLMCGMR